jgi:hypothetical protein
VSLLAKDVAMNKHKKKRSVDEQNKKSNIYLKGAEHQ